MATSLIRANDLISGFFPWWLKELAAMWRPLRGFVRSGPKMLTLDASDEQWVLRLQKGARLQELGRLDSQSLRECRAEDPRDPHQESQASQCRAHGTAPREQEPS